MSDALDDDPVRQENLRYLVNEWDPLRVADVVEDEYDCLVVPLWNLLRQGADRATVSEFLWYEMQDHFGLDPDGIGTDRFADRMMAWVAKG